MTNSLQALSRRRLLGAGAAVGGLALAGCAGVPTSGPSIGRVVIVGGGFGGSTAARYLRMWGGNVDVTLVERNPNFISCPISNLVIGGHKQMADITRGYEGLKAIGVKVMQGDGRPVGIQWVVLETNETFQVGEYQELVYSAQELPAHPELTVSPSSTPTPPP